MKRSISRKQITRQKCQEDTIDCEIDIVNITSKTAPFMMQQACDEWMSE